jgi:uncharacterized protein with GYD domain
VRNPQDRPAAIKTAVESLGGRLVCAYCSFGEYDIVAIVELPDAVSAAALGMAVSAGGAVKSHKTTPLLSGEETLAAVRKAAAVPYKPPA